MYGCSAAARGQTRCSIGVDTLFLHVQALDWSEATQWGGLKQGATFPKPEPVYQRLPSDSQLAPAGLSTLATAA